MCSTAATRLAVRLLLAGVALASVHPSTTEAADAEDTFIIQSWDRREGLPAAVIQSIQRGPSGYLWLATQRGLSRFDGERFQLFNPRSNPEFRTNWTTCVLADSSGGVWLGTPTGLFFQAPRGVGNARWREVGHELSVRAIVEGEQGIVLALCEGNTLVQIRNGKVEKTTSIPHEQHMRILLSGPKGLLAAGRGGGGVLIADQWVPMPAAIVEKLRPDIVSSCSMGGYWMAAERGVVRVIETNGQFQAHMVETDGEAPQSGVIALLEDRQGRLWAGTRLGTVHCLPGTNSGTRVWRQVTPKRLRSLGPVSCIYEDPEGLIWVGTTAGYLHKIRSPLVSVWPLPAMTQKNVSHTVCVTRDGAVWAGTDGSGAYRFRNGTVERFSAEQGLPNTVITILEDRATNLWFGTSAGLHRFESGRSAGLQAGFPESGRSAGLQAGFPESGRFVPELQSHLHRQPVSALFEDSKGRLWFGGLNLVVCKSGDEIETFPIRGIGQNREVRAIVEDPDGAMWIGTRGEGLFRLQDGEVRRFERFRHPGVLALHCDGKGHLWVGTATRGLFRVAATRLGSWSRADGLPSRWIHSILEDDSGALWLATNEGIVGVTKPALIARANDRETPLLTIQVAASGFEGWSTGSGQPSAAKGPDGRLWFPAGHGVLSFDPAELMRQRPRFPILIEAVEVDGVEQTVSDNSPLTLHNGFKRLEFRYTIADLDSPGQLRFRYRLDGLDDGWVDAGVQRSATYGPLPVGDYTFRVISAGSGSDWTETANPLGLQIIPHFWQTAWFQTTSALVALSVVGLAALLFGRIKLRRKLERLEMQHAMERERRRIAQDLHDDLGSGISEIVFLSELARQEQNEVPAQMRTQLSDITAKARKIATAMDEIVWTVNPKNDSLPDLASYLCDYAREFLRSGNVSCRIDSEEQLPKIPLTAQQRHNLFMGVKEALNNAVKHSGANEIWLHIDWDDAQQTLAVTVEDNGRGFDVEKAKNDDSGNGLSNMQSRLEAIGGSARFISAIGKGTRARFILQLSPAPTATRPESLN